MFKYIIGGLIIVFVFIYILLKIEKKRKTEAIIKKLQTLGEVTLVSGLPYNLTLEVEETLIYIKLLYLGKTQELSINSNRHWQVKSGSKSYLLKTKGFELVSDLKVIIVYPKPEKLVKYINENEIVFIKPEEKAFDFYLFTEADIDLLQNLKP